MYKICFKLLIFMTALLYGANQCSVLAKTCRAQNILDACLSMQKRQFKRCEYDEWQCKCHAQKKILTCYDNCPDLDDRALQEMQVQVYCAALSGKEFNSHMMDQMTRAAKVDADKEPHSKEPNERPKNKEVGGGGGSSTVLATSTESKDKLAGKSKGDSGFSIIRDNGAVSCGSGVYSMILLMAVNVFYFI